MAFVKLNCPNCNGKLKYKEGQTIKCPYCETELLLKENKVYYINQTINNYYGEARPKPNFKALLLIPFVIIFAFLAYFIFGDVKQENHSRVQVDARTMPESEALLFFLKDIFNKGEALPTEEEIATIRYFFARKWEDQWHFDYSFDDPFSNEQAEIFSYTLMDKLLNKERIDQRDFEAFVGLTKLKLDNEYDIQQSDQISFPHLKSYSSAFNEAFVKVANSIADKEKIVELSTQIRNNQELALLLDFPNLQSLEITYVNESVTDFHLLNQLKLKSFAIHYVDDLTWLSSLTNLQTLKIIYTDATDFSSLYALSQLRELSVEHAKNLKTLDFLQSMPNLQALHLNATYITNLEPIRNKQSLTRLSLENVFELDSLEVLASLPSIIELKVKGYYNGTVPTIIAPNLKKAELDEDFVAKLQAPALESLSVYLGAVFDIKQLLKFPQLEQFVTLKGEGLINIPAFNQLSSMQTLYLNDTYFFDETNELFSLQYVKTLSCVKCSLNFIGQKAFTNNVLEHLTLNKVSFEINHGDWLNDANKMVPYFADMTALRSFTMQDSSLQSLSFMEKWQQIEVLHLENNAINNVEPLLKLANLRKLYILGNPVQNKSVLDKGVVVY
ncbi:leucine-rich repeat domain-containing protein [Metasolibacillus meyeri]|uniref:Leucine-rich repeat domain-containing protein n=1 Tax=Metasolibacillus meyeri TaxID=1071052 RepID=A0AAW9NSQ7_9BACL|nr:leucine-rich repeat domain-containing protein [Metasolibacillus meyeri]MEC1178389.1 leucine-rich repeat domain-containing protein [Metasolibacillus meyeri]